MPRRPKPKNTLTAGERVALYEAEMEKKQRRLHDVGAENGNFDPAPDLEIKSGSNAEFCAREESGISLVKPEKIKKQLPKPERATVKVDFSVPMGKIKPLHGMCNGPVSYGADISRLFREIGVPSVRFDCTDTAVSAYAIDVSRIFKDPDADPSDPANYDFSVTDKYVEAAYLAGARVIYRLGESVDPFGAVSAKKDFDIEILSRVCVNIIKHYNDGWARGYYYGIDRFDILNIERDLTDGEVDETFEKYRHLAGAVKLYDDNLKVGGMSFDLFGGEAKDFLRYCRKKHAPLDFVTVDCFCGDPRAAYERAFDLFRQIRTLGYEDVEIIVGKWSFADASILGETTLNKVLLGNGEKHSAMRKELFGAQRTVKGAAFSAAFLLEMLRADGIASCYFYDAQPMLSPFCAVADRFGEAEKPFYVFETFGELYRAKNAALCEVCELDDYAHTGIYAAAALSDSGECYVMISSFGGCGTVDLRLDGIPDDLYTADVYMLDGVKNMEKCNSVPLSGMKKRLIINVSEFGAVFVKLY